MSEQEIIEGNKLIAEFMGGIYVRREDLFDSHIIEEFIYNNNHPILKNNIKTTEHLYHLRYHLSWDWLMPVVEKIGRLNSLEENGEWFNFVIQNGKVPTNTYCTCIGRVGEYSRNLGNVSSGKSSSLIESNWLCIIEFIKWYNLCQKEK